MTRCLPDYFLDLDSSRPVTDRKHYRLGLIPGSGLEVLLVQTDGRRGRAAAALTVGVGSFSDPEGLEGLAHFLEHMIFMGSDKYPEENAYDSFVETHGGFCNAFTEGESTTYEFDIDSEHFASALDIFAHCFISPKLSDSSADREILAIDNEFHLAEMNDEARCQEVYCACCARATPNHFFSRFSWGNLHSLKEVPASLGIDTHKELRKFYETHYRPNRMKLVLISPYSMDVMYDMLSSAFGPWVDTAPTACAPSSRSSSDSGSSAALSTARGISCISTSGAISLQGFAMPFFGERPSLARFQPIKNHHRLDVYWPIDAANPAIHYRRKCAECVAHLLGHEGPGSAVSLLKKSGLITELSAGVGEGSYSKNSRFSIFHLSILLTAPGVANWIDVMSTVYSYLGLLNSPEGMPYWMFDELKTIAQLKYDFGDENDEDDLAENLSVLMSQFEPNSPPLELLPSEELFFDFDKEGIASIMQCLAPSKAHIQLASSLFSHTELRRDSLSRRRSSSDSSSSGNSSSLSEGEDAGGEGSGDTARSEEEEWEDVDMDEHDALEDADPIVVPSASRKPPVAGREASERSSFSDFDEESEEGSDSETDGGGDDLVVPSPKEIEELCTVTAGWRHLVLPSLGSVVPETLLERHFGTKLWLDVMPDDLILAWEHLYWGEAPRDDRLNFPPPNPYIISKIPRMDALEPVKPTDSGKHELPSVFYPEGDGSSYKNNRLVVFRYMDKIGEWSESPKVVISVKLSSYIAQRDVHGHVGNDLLGFVVPDVLNEITYMASMAELHCSFESDDFGLSFIVYGFREKAADLVIDILNRIFNLKNSNDINVDRLRAQGGALLRQYANEGLKAGASASQARRQALLPSRFAPAVCQKVLAQKLDDLSAAQAMLKQYAYFFACTCCVDILVHGACPDEDVARITECAKKNILQSCTNIINAGPSAAVCAMALSAVQSRTVRVTRLPPRSSHLLLVAPRSPHERNVCLEIYFQAPRYDATTLTYLDLLEHILSEPFFNDVRTKKQMGYNVSCDTKLTYGVPGFSFQVVSSSHELSEIQAAVLAFISRVPTLLETLTNEQYSKKVASLLNVKMAPDVSMHEQAMMFWSEICDRRYDFNAKWDIIECLKASPSKEDLKRFAVDLFLFKSKDGVATSPRMMVIQSSVSHPAPGTWGPRRLGGARQPYSSSSAAAAGPLRGLPQVTVVLRQPSEAHKYSSV